MIKIEPPMGSVIIDVSGSAWQRVPNGWTIAGGDGSWFYTWKRMVEQELYTVDKNYVATGEWKPATGDPRLPFIAYVPHEELFTNETEEE